MTKILYALIMLHTLDGRTVWINPELITALHAPSSTGNKLYVPGVRCAVALADGKVITVVEPCDAIEAWMRR